MTRQRPAFLTLILFFSSIICPYAQKATISESTRMFPTYPFNDPDPVPRFTTIYPYFRFDGYSIRSVQKEWKVVVLENPYIKVLVAPEIGGKVLGAIEKSTGKEFLYFNKAVKFREIAMRGPWTSGGLEFNFGDIGHTPSTATPVDYVTRTNKDGSVSCFVGAPDLASRTEWRVEIRLPADRAYFETNSYWYNPTDLSTSMYHWMNAAVEADDDVQLLFPGKAYIGHDGELQSWPIDSAGRDISLYANNNFGSYKSYHVLGSYTDFYSVRWMKDDFGVVHWAPYADKPGKKVWIWGLSRQGEIWKDLLADGELGNKQYVEIQSGLLFNQALPSSRKTPFKHQALPPHTGVRFTEAWFPYMRTGGVTEANLNGVLNVVARDGNVVMSFCPLAAVHDEMTMFASGKVVYRKRLNLSPLKTFTDSVPLEGSIPWKVAIGSLISCGRGDSAEKMLDRPLAAPAQFDWNSVYGVYTDAVESARQREYAGALEQFRKCLAMDPDYKPALSGMAEVYYRRMEYDRAMDAARSALAIDTYDPGANFVYGCVSRHMGRWYDALDGFGIASRSNGYRTAALVQLAEISFRLGQYADASAYARRGLEYDTKNIRAFQILIASCRAMNNTSAAGAALRQLQEIDPLSHFVDAERYLLAPSPKTAATLVSRIRYELPHEIMLELAAYYLGLGLFHDAAMILEQSPPQMMRDFWLAYLYTMSGEGERGRERLRAALEASPRLVFPFRSEDEGILQWANGVSAHWKTEYCLAMLYSSKGRMDLARQFFDECGDPPDFAPFYLARAAMYASIDRGIMVRNYQEANEIGSDEWRTYTALADYYTSEGLHAKALEVSETADHRFGGRYTQRFNLARAYLFAGKHEKSVSILDTLEILPFEGARYGRELYREAFDMLAAEEIRDGNFQDAVALVGKAMEWPERLGVGKPYVTDDRFEFYLLARAHELAGNKEKAAMFLREASTMTSDRYAAGKVNNILSALALKRMGKETEARKILDAWSPEGRKDPSGEWCAAFIANDTAKIATIERQLRGPNNASLLSLSSLDPNFALLVEIDKIIHIR